MDLSVQGSVALLMGHGMGMPKIRWCWLAA